MGNLLITYKLTKHQTVWPSSHITDHAPIVDDRRVVP